MEESAPLTIVGNGDVRVTDLANDLATILAPRPVIDAPHRVAEDTSRPSCSSRHRRSSVIIVGATRTRRMNAASWLQLHLGVTEDSHPSPGDAQMKKQGGTYKASRIIPRDPSCAVSTDDAQTARVVYYELILVIYLHTCARPQVSPLPPAEGRMKVVQ